MKVSCCACDTAFYCCFDVRLVELSARVDDGAGTGGFDLMISKFETSFLNTFT